MEVLLFNSPKFCKKPEKILQTPNVDEALKLCIYTYMVIKVDDARICMQHIYKPTLLYTAFYALIHARLHIYIYIYIDLTYRKKMYTCKLLTQCTFSFYHSLLINAISKQNIETIYPIQSGHCTFPL